MAVSTTSDKLTQISAEALVLGMYAESRPEGAAAEFDQASGGLLTRLLESKEISGKKAEVVTLLAPPGVKAGTVLIVGLGAKGDLDRGVAYRAAAAAAKTLASRERGRVAFCLAQGSPADVTEAAVCGSVVGCVGQDLYRAKKNRFPLGDIVWAGIEAAVAQRGEILGEAVNLTRRLVNEPPSEMYPESFAAEAVRVAEASGIAIEVWDRARLEAERCGSLLAVARGSSREARLVILKYNGGASGAPPLALVGKGVTFDSGGLSIKPTDGMKTMKCDMAGGATVLGAMQAIARLGLPVNAIGLVGLVENMLSGDSYKLGDVLRARSGKTIEVLNTDAEGRLVLADVLDVCLQHNPARIIDLATLTGACVVALGNDVAGLMTNDQAWCDAVRSAADACGEPMWQLPMFPEYGEQIRSEVADIKNVGDGRWGGAITAAKFLEEFVQGKPWVHIDIAGPSFLEGSKPWIDAGGSGFGLRTLVEVVLRGAETKMTRLLNVALIGLLIGCGPTGTEAEMVKGVFGSEENVALMRSATKVSACRIKPRKADESESGEPPANYDDELTAYIEEDWVDVSPDQAARFKTALGRPHTYAFGVAKSCLPIYGVRLRFEHDGKSLEVNFCFECLILLVSRDGKDVGGEDFEYGARELTALCKELFPNDQEIQAIEAR